MRTIFFQTTPPLEAPVPLRDISDSGLGLQSRDAGSHRGSAEGRGEEGACSCPGRGLADFPSVMASG